jgi:transcriptional regulator with AAA-type ATPase domain
MIVVGVARRKGEAFRRRPFWATPGQQHFFPDVRDGMGPDSPVQVDGVLTAVDYLRAGGREVGYPDSATIIRRGDPGKDFFVLLSGRLDVILPGADGQQLPLAHLEPGASFGEMSILTGSAVSADIVARGPVRLLVYPGERLRTALAESTAVREHVLGSLISGLRRADLDMWNTSQHMRALSGLAGKSVRTGPLIMASPLMQALQKRIGELSARILPILVAGDLGVGKLFIARKIHEAGCGSGGEGLGSSAAPFIVVDCLRLGVGEAARLIFGSATAGFVLPGESDFAGPEGKAKPASTGSESLPLLGAIHLAAGGTLVLQHIEALEGSAQEILCRYLDAQASRDTYPHTRVIGTTRRDPAVLAEAADVFPALREHFAKRTVGVPRLRDRKRDILPLARMFLEEDNQRLHGRDRRFALSAERALVSNQYRHHNVTELREAVEFAAVFADTPEILQEHIFTGPRDQGTGPEYDLAQLPVVMRLTRGRGLSVVRAGVLLLFAAIAVLCLFAGRSASGWCGGFGGRR